MGGTKRNVSESECAGEEGKRRKKKNEKKEVEAAQEQCATVNEQKSKRKSKKQRIGDDSNKSEKKENQVATKNGGDDNGKIEPGVELEVSVSGKDSSDPQFAPWKAFDKLPAAVASCCSKFEKPSTIQAHSWPFLLHGRDLIGIAATGSGKTLAFGVPALMHVINKRESRKQKHPLCLVLSPTRELAQQIAAVLEEAGATCNVKVTCVFGGSSKGPQEAALRAGPEIVVATPGRLQDFLDGGACKLNHVTYLVLDEADRMLDLGFEPAVRAIVSHTHKKRQTLMFSATWPIEVEKLAKEFIQDPSPVTITVGSQDLAANHDVAQIVEVLDDRARNTRLIELLKDYHKSKKNRVLVFVLYKDEADRVEKFVRSRGYKVMGIHGNKSQVARNEAFNAFKDGSHPLLIATDVAARGLDIPDVEYVINYSFPLTTADYVHRIGRTGRAGKKGTAHTFFTTANKALAGELVNVLREAKQPVPEELMKFGTHVKKKESKLYGAHFREIPADAPKAKKITFESDDD